MDTVCKDFLERFCPHPALLEQAIKRSGLWGIKEVAPNEAICRLDERAEACWIIVSGQVEISREGGSVAFRTIGEMIGEQALLTTLLGKRKGRRSADMIARGPVRLVCIDAAFQEQLKPDEASAWHLTLAAVVNDKLAKSTQQRVRMQNEIDAREALLRRFAEGDALNMVRRVTEDDPAPVATREAIVWFSDLENFSVWAANQSPNVVADTVRALIGRQIALIREADGQIDKLMGDGLMAIWFVDSTERRERLPYKVIECAQRVAASISNEIDAMGLGRKMGIRIGLHSGPTSFGDFGAAERIAVTVVGDTVNLASRYEQAKASGLSAIRVSPTLKKLVDEHTTSKHWAFSGPTKVEVKHGKVIEVYCLNSLEI